MDNYDLTASMYRNVCTGLLFLHYPLFVLACPCITQVCRYMFLCTVLADVLAIIGAPVGVNDPTSVRGYFAVEF